MKLTVFEDMMISLWSERKPSSPVDDVQALGRIAGVCRTLSDNLIRDRDAADDFDFLADFADTLAQDVKDYIKSLAQFGLLGEVVIYIEGNHA